MLTVSSHLSGPSFASTSSSISSLNLVDHRFNPNTSSLYLHSPLSGLIHSHSLKCHPYVEDSQFIPPLVIRYSNLKCSRCTLTWLPDIYMLIENSNMAKIKYLIFLHLFPNYSTCSLPNIKQWYHYSASCSRQTLDTSFSSINTFYIVHHFSTFKQLTLSTYSKELNLFCLTCPFLSCFCEGS